MFIGLEWKMSRGDLDNIKCIKIGPKYISRKNDIKER